MRLRAPVHYAEVGNSRVRRSERRYGDREDVRRLAGAGGEAVEVGECTPGTL